MTEQPRAEGYVAVDGGHRISWQEWGNPDGAAALYLHGGPGGGLGREGYRKRFDLAKWRVIAMDQRGCSRSRPLVTEPGYDLTQNTTDLVTHYWAHNRFLDPPLVEAPGALAGIPIDLVHGRRDVSGPVRTAWLAQRALPHATLTVVEDEGHGGPRMVEEWSAALASHLPVRTTELSS